MSSVKDSYVDCFRNIMLHIGFLEELRANCECWKKACSNEVLYSGFEERAED